MAASTTTSEVALFDITPLRFRLLLTSGEFKSRVSLASILRSPPVACSPDGQLIIAAPVANSLKGWEVDTGRLRFSVPVKSRIRGLVFLPTGRSFIVLDEAVSQFSAENGQVMEELTMPGKTQATAVAVAPEGHSILVGLVDGRIVEIDLRSLQITRTLRGHTGPVTGIAFAPDGAAFASTAGRFDPRVWNYAESEPLPRSVIDIGSTRESLGRAQRATQALALFTWLLGSGTGFQIVDAPTLGAPPALTHEVQRAASLSAKHCEPAIAYSPDGRYLAVTANLSLLSGEYHLLLVDLVRNEGRVISGIYGCSVSFSHDSKFVAMGGLGSPLLWDLERGAEVK